MYALSLGCVCVFEKCVFLSVLVLAALCVCVCVLKSGTDGVILLHELFL